LAGSGSNSRATQQQDCYFWDAPLVETARRQREAEIDVTIKEFDIARAQLAALLALSNCNL
jgi:hypothetical protein